MVDDFEDEVFRWDEGFAVDAATFLADDTNKLSAFSVENGEFEWSPETQNTVEEGEERLSLDGYTDTIGNDIISPWNIPARTARQLDWLFTNRFNGGDKSAQATIGVYDQDRGSWDVFTCIATWQTGSSVNNRYRNLTVIWTEAEVLA